MTRHVWPPLILSMFAAPAVAEITADDVWANTVGYYEATGTSVDATLLRDGDTLTIADVTWRLDLPFDFGAIRLTLPDMVMVELGDGTVRQTLPETFTLTAAFEPQDEMVDALQTTVTIRHEDFVSVAAGTPDDITYTRSGGAYGAALEVDFSRFGAGDGNMFFEVFGEGYSNVTRIVAGDLITAEFESTSAPMQYSYVINGGVGYSEEGNGLYQTILTSGEVSIPSEGVDILDLAAAFDAGLAMSFSTTGAGQEDVSATYIDGGLVTETRVDAGPSSAEMQISSDGFAIASRAQDIGFEMRENAGLFPGLSVAVSDTSMSFSFPFMAALQAQEFGLSLAVDNLTLADEVWDMFDPGAYLSRDPASWDLDLGGQIQLDLDLVDVPALEAAFDRAEVPITLQSFSLRRFAANAVGVTAKADGAFTFDDTDLDSFFGMPRPEGSGQLTLTGVNEMLDLLLDTEIAPPSQVNAARQMIGSFTRPTDDDALTSTVEINTSGGIMVNGERIR